LKNNQEVDKKFNYLLPKIKPSFVNNLYLINLFYKTLHQLTVSFAPRKAGILIFNVFLVCVSFPRLQDMLAHVERLEKKPFPHFSYELIQICVGHIVAQECCYPLLTYFLTYLLITYLLTPRGRVFLEQLTGSQLVKKFPAFYGSRRFIAAFTSPRQLSLS
jgi:hypothetical protein